MADQFETQARTLWLICHDQEFLHRYREGDQRVFPLGPSRYLIDLALRHYNEYRRVLTDDSVALAMENDGARLRRNRCEPAMVTRVWRDLAAFAVAPNALPGARDTCGAWFQRRSGLVRTEQAAQLYDRGDIEAAEEVLRRQPQADDREDPLSFYDSDYVLANALHGEKRGGIPTGIYDLDTAWRGGGRPGKLGMVAAPTGVGKSQILTMMAAEAFWRGLRVLYYDFELGREEIIKRIALACLKKGLYDIKLDEMDKEWERAARDRRGQFGDYTVREGPLTFPQLEEDLARWKEENGGAYPDLLLVDSIDDMVPPGRFDVEWQALKQSWRRMRSLAMQTNIPVWSSSQMKQEAVDGQWSSLKKIAGAYAKATLCHYVLGCAQTPEERVDPSGPILNVFVLKDSLHGTTGGWLICKTEFGDGDNGYPGLQTIEARNLPVIMKGMHQR